MVHNRKLHDQLKLIYLASEAESVTLYGTLVSNAPSKARDSITHQLSPLDGKRLMTLPSLRHISNSRA